VGRISPPKGIHLLIEAFNLVKQEIPAAKLVIVGKHSLSGYSKKLKQMSDTSVIFTGDVSDEDLPCYYAACNVYATATLWEGFDLPVAEAQVCGKPVVAFDIGPHPEVVKDKEAGILVPYKNTQALADAISEILKRNLNVGNVIYE
jgi:1,2-diacylglycerol 3-alpha-glucosyltransferase